MERALDLLEDDTLSIQDVAEKVGYNGISNFYAVFRQNSGIRPLRYKKLLETNNLSRCVMSIWHRKLRACGVLFPVAAAILHIENKRGKQDKEGPLLHFRRILPPRKTPPLFVGERPL